MIWRLRREVGRVFFEAGLVEPHGNIIAMGRDAGVPHNEGNDKDVLEEGRPIVVDLYPAQENGGYYFDVTPTYCVGRAPQELKAPPPPAHDPARPSAGRPAGRDAGAG